MPHDSSLSQNIHYFDLTSSEIELLRRAFGLIADELPEMQDTFYDFALAQTEIARFFGPEKNFAHAKGRQKEHWSMLLSGDFSQNYLKSAEIVGRVHFQIDLPFNIYLSGYSRVSSDLLNRLLKNATEQDASLEEIGQMMGVVTRVFAFDNDFIIRAYFDAQREEQDRALTYLSDGLTRMAAGDVSLAIPGPKESDFPVRFDGIREDFNSGQKLMRTICSQISSVAANMEGSASNLGEATDQLARRTESQAATLEESSAAVEELAESARHSSDNAKRADAEMVATSKNTQAAHDVMTEAVELMQTIEESSREVKGKISAINDIAFQTNLLALNAGVEAARAGEQGRGFAVVASEVRALAGRAADASREINAIIEHSGKQIGLGTERVSQTGKMLEGIAQKVAKVTELVSDITTTSGEQSLSLSTVNTAVSNLDSATQQNAAMAEETSATAQDMMQSLTELTNTVAQITVAAPEGGLGARRQPAARVA